MTTVKTERSMRIVRFGAVLLSAGTLLAPSVLAQGTIDDYRRAAGVNQRLNSLSVDIAQTPTWTDATHFWYRKSVKGGNEFVMVDAATGQKTAAFDHARLATSLSTVSGAS